MKSTDLTPPPEWPSPEEAARDYAVMFENDAIGVRHDALMDASMEVEDHRHQIQQTVIALDHVIDDMSAQPGRMLDEVSKVHGHMQSYLHWLTEFQKAIDREFEAVKEEMNDGDA